MYLKLNTLPPDRGIPHMRQEEFKDFWAPDGTHRRVNEAGQVHGDFDETTAADLLATGAFLEDKAPRPIAAVLTQAEAVGTFLAQLRNAARLVWKAMLQHDETARAEANAVVSEVRAEVEAEIGPPPAGLPTDDDPSGEDDAPALVPPAEQNPAAPATAGDPRQGDPAAGEQPAAGKPDAPVVSEDPNIRLAEAFELLHLPPREVRDRASAMGMTFPSRTQPAAMIAKMLGLPEGWEQR